MREWSDDTYQSGVFLLCIDGSLFPKEIFTSTLTIDIITLKRNLSTIVRNEKLFNMPKEEAFIKMYHITFPSWEEIDNGADQNYQYYMSPPGIEDFHSTAFAVSNGKQVRIMASNLNYNEKESTCDLSEINIKEAFISHEELNELVIKLEDVIHPKSKMAIG